MSATHDDLVRIEQKLDTLMSMIEGMRTEILSIGSEATKMTNAFESSVTKMNNSLVAYQLVYNAASIGRDVNKLTQSTKSQDEIKANGEVKKTSVSAVSDASTAALAQSHPSHVVGLDSTTVPEVVAPSVGATTVPETPSLDEELVVKYLTHHIASGETIMKLQATGKTFNVNELYCTYFDVTNPNESLENIIAISRPILRDCEKGVVSRLTKVMNLIVKKAREFASAQVTNE